MDSEKEVLKQRLLGVETARFAETAGAQVHIGGFAKLVAEEARGAPLVQHEEQNAPENPSKTVVREAVVQERPGVFGQKSLGVGVISLDDQWGGLQICS